MRYGRSILAGICIISILFAEKTGTARAAVAVPETYLYVRVTLGDCYPGRQVEYDIAHKRTILEPHEGEKQLIVRDDDSAVLYYGKYRGRSVYDNYRVLSPVLDLEFFYAPFRELNVTREEIKEQEFKIHLEDERDIERFLEPLAFAGVVNRDEVEVEEIQIATDEIYRPVEVRFQLDSEILTEAQIAYLEEELVQTYEYIERREFEEHYAKSRKTVLEIVTEEEIAIADYAMDLANILRTKDTFFIQRLTHQGEELEKRAGWDKQAVYAYLEAVDTKFNTFGGNGYEAQNVTREEYLLELENIYKAAHRIGSDVYTYMFEASEIPPKKKALLVLRQMGAYIDINGMLQLGPGDRFAPEMTPHDVFLEEYARCVRMAYEKVNHQYRPLDNQMLHQFRMYIDRHNIEYVRNYYDGPTDYEKLKAYAEKFNLKLYYGEPSRHHNKIRKMKGFESQECDKILTPNRLSEFILDVKTGSFVTEWDVLVSERQQTIESEVQAYGKQSETKEKQIVNTESFNYAPADFAEAHNSLDVLPATPSGNEEKSFYLENKLKRAMKEKWESPGVFSYWEKYKSPRDYLK